MTRYLPLLIVLLIPLEARAQAVPDTTAPWLYYPLGHGDVWDYERYPADYPRFIRREIVGDTIADGQTYAIQRLQRKQEAMAEWIEHSRSYLRYDTTTTRIMWWSPNGENPAVCNLGAAFNSTVECYEGSYDSTEVYGGYGGVVDVGGSAVPVLARKWFYTPPGDVVTQRVYAAPLGWVGDVPGLCTFCRIDLRFARVDGVEYGTPVSAEPAAEAPTVAVLSASPNPAGGTVGLTLTLPSASAVRVDVYDVLGRHVTVVHEGPLSAGYHQMDFDATSVRPGTYIVRASGGAWVATTRIVAL